MSSSSNIIHYRVALLGNPNAGKSSIFNVLTGLNQKTGNYSGVTVDRYEGRSVFVAGNIKHSFSIIDLPGLYSLYPRSDDELIACRTLLDPREKIDVIVIVADSTNLKRNLLLATQLLDLKFKTVIALNMFDEAEHQNISIDIEGLRKTLGAELVPVDSRRQKGFSQLKEAITRAKPSESVFFDPSREFPGGYKTYRDYISGSVSGKLASLPGKDANSDKLYRYNIINYLMAKYVKSPEKLSQKEFSAKIDAVVTHKISGYAVLLLILFLVFQFIFYISETPMFWIEGLFLNAGEAISGILPAGQLNDLIVKGIIAGVSGVVMFVPQIAFLFLFIGLLEDSGYMARASFIMDRVMRPFGLNGRSVIPLISGTACAVPSIMATRSISNVKERLITIFILPLISCSARLPVYTLLIAVMYPDKQILGIFNAKGLVLLLLYLLGFAAAMLLALVMKSIVKTSEPSYFIMELPVYRKPQLRNIALMVFNKVKVFVVEAGKIIVAISIVLWFLSSHGSRGPAQTAGTESRSGKEITGAEQKNRAQDRLVSKEGNIEDSYIGRLGKFIEPVIAPLGFDWKIGIAVLTSFAAREVFVGTMSTIYRSGDINGDESIKDKLMAEKDEGGNPRYTGAVCWSLLLFYAFALQCMSTVAIVKRETKSWKWVFAQLLFMSALAYLSSFTVYNLLA